MGVQHSPVIRPSTPKSPTVVQATNTATNVILHKEPVTTTSTSSNPTQQPPIMLSPNSMSSKHAQQQAIYENEQFALAWLRATFEPTSNITHRVEQQEMYKIYVNASTKIGRRGVVSPLHFPRCVRSIFGGTVGPNPVKNENQSITTEMIQYYYEGIRMRTKALPVIHNGTVMVRKWVLYDIFNIISINKYDQYFYYRILPQIHKFPKM